MARQKPRLAKDKLISSTFPQKFNSLTSPLAIKLLIKKYHWIIISLVILGILAVFYLAWYLKTTYFFEKRAVRQIQTTPHPNITKFDFTIVFVGDSMTEYLGNLQELGYFLNQDYPNKHFLLLNYGYSSTNVLSLPDRLEKDSTHSGRIFQAIDKINFNLIIIESFGNNPLAQYPLEQGLKKQNEALDQAINLITQNHPKSSIIFLATIAPNKEEYGLNAVQLTADQRELWANERSAYIKNHIAYAKSHNIPVIDLYDQSQIIPGDGSLLYLNPLDHIHPSVVGIYFIDNKIADFIYQHNLVP